MRSLVTTPGGTYIPLPRMTVLIGTTEERYQLSERLDLHVARRPVHLRDLGIEDHSLRRLDDEPSVDLVGGAEQRSDRVDSRGLVLTEEDRRPGNLVAVPVDR